MDKAVLLAPAVYVTTAGIDFYNSIFPILRAELINLVLRPRYWETDIRNVCEPPAGDVAADERETACWFVKQLKGAPTTVKSFEHLHQIAITRRWQEYVEGFSVENSEAPTVDPSKITKVPIQIVQCEKDSALPNEGIEDLMGDSVQLWTTVPDVDNPWFETQTASEQFFNLVKE